MSTWSYKVIEIGKRIGSNNFNCPVTAHQNGLQMRKFGQCSISLSKMTEPRKVENGYYFPLSSNRNRINAAYRKLTQDPLQSLKNASF